MEREAFLGRIRDAISSGSLPPAPQTDPGLSVPHLPPGDLVEMFTRSLVSIDGEVHSGDPTEEVLALCRRYGASSFLSWDNPELGVPALNQALIGSGLKRIDAAVPEEPPARRSHQHGYMDVVVGITGAEAAFAESGSIVLRSGWGRPRMVSLIPLVHIALLAQDRIHRSLSHWMAEAVETVGDPANLVFISGPSRTGDIEQQLNLGVHGPRHLHVILTTGPADQL